MVIITDILNLLLQSHKKEIVFLWLPSHIEVEGNYIANALARDTAIQLIGTVNNTNKLKSILIDWPQIENITEEYISYQWNTNCDQKDKNTENW